MLGGIVYEYLDFRLVALSNAPAVQSLPALLRVPLSEPLFLLGVLFIVLVLFVPGGLGGALRRRAAPLSECGGPEGFDAAPRIR